MFPSSLFPISISIYKVKGGIKEDGKPDLKTKSYMNIQPGSSADALITASETIASLQSLPLVEINEVVTFSLLK